MEYMTAAEAAGKWRVSLRQVQRLLLANRIPHTRRYGRSWLIPADAEKPGDPRREKGPLYSLSADFDYIIMGTCAPAPHDDPDAVLENEERLRLPQMFDRSYLYGDFEYIKSRYQTIKGDDAVKLRASGAAISAAISTGDYPFFLKMENYLKNIIRIADSERIIAYAELCLSTAYMGAIAPRMVPGWLKDGDFAALPPQTRLFAAYERALYFQSLGKMECVLAVAQTALALWDLKQGVWGHDIYLQILCAIACSRLEREDEAERWLLKAMKIALPHGFITPFVENLTYLEGSLKQIFEREYPEHYTAATVQWKYTFSNWLDFHNRFTKDNITLILSLREYEMASLAVRGVSYAKIAEQFNISEGRARNIIQEICEKLFVHGKKELSKVIL